MFDLLSSANPGKDSQGGFNLHLMALSIPIAELGLKVTSKSSVFMQQPVVKRSPCCEKAAEAIRREQLLHFVGAGRAPGQPALQRRPRRHRGQGPLQPHQPDRG